MEVHGVGIMDLKDNLTQIDLKYKNKYELQSKQLLTMSGILDFHKTLKDDSQWLLS
eukprot:CAMPEP_0116880168 /NCGR_PEP_ID=MMETSP0463-20121206/12065_1 /TAXON_ID=181622 /ORGANISM="Strombidinopsis sp, Strain SopsisLIS2011" /LENGTH=55 /DNA_ID=CAMNT_0004530413 /DNA_START=86 /DNA_END=253 /DNA_ORIENTATION=-